MDEKAESVKMACMHFIRATCLACLALLGLSCFPLEFSRINPKMKAKDISSQIPDEDTLALQPSSLCSGNEETLVRSQVTIKFPDTLGQTCEWGVGQNGSEGEHGLATSAYRQQNQLIPLPPQHHICGLQLQHKVGLGQRYNDALLFSINGYFLASSHLSQQMLDGILGKNQGNLTKIEAKDLIGVHTGRTMGCASNTTCKIPRSQRQGTLSLEASSEYFNKLYLNLAHHQELWLELTVTGKRGVIDCQHSGFTLEGTVFSYPIEQGITQLR